MKGVRRLETLCTVCDTVVGVKLHYRGQAPSDHRVARHAEPNSPKTRWESGQRAKMCAGTGIVVDESAVIPVEVSA